MPKLCDRIELVNKRRCPMFNSNSENFTQDQELIVRRYVNSTLFNIDTFIEYLKNNSIIEFDIFKKSCKKKVSYSFLRCYKPIPRDVFISRLPIYFYDLKVSTFNPPG